MQFIFGHACVPKRYFGVQAWVNLTGAKTDMGKPLFKASEGDWIGRNVPRKPSLVGGVTGRNRIDISYPGSPALRAWSFTC